MLVLGWREVLSPIANTRYPVQIVDNGKHVTIRVRPASPIAKYLSTGDEIDLGGMPLAARIRLNTGSPVGTPIDVRVRHNGIWSTQTLRAKTRPIRLTTGSIALIANVTITLLIVAIIVARRPSLATCALVMYGGGSVTTSAVVAQFSMLPDPFFVGIAGFILSAFSEFPIFVLLLFLTRFPNTPTTRAARVRMRIGDGVVFAAATFVIVCFLYEPVYLQTWETAHNTFEGVGILLTLLFAIAAYREAAGEDRQRTGWVLCGIVTSQASLLVFNVLDNAASSPTIDLIRAVLFILQLALPISLAYAILRYRVIDLGFVFNRTLVYAIVTAIVVVGVSFVDWLSSRLISETRLALAAEAIVTIALGVALNALHGRIEHLVDRVVFRRRYIAEKKLRSRLNALAFATNERAVDLALTDEILQILNLRSAAVFRSVDGGALACANSVGWSPPMATLDENSLLVRTIRASDKPFFLADVGVSDPIFADGASTPILVVPIEHKQFFVGFALYGSDAEGIAPDPEIIAHLAELANAAATTYELVEARSWQRRYESVIELLPPNVLIAD